MCHEEFRQYVTYMPRGGWLVKSSQKWWHLSQAGLEVCLELGGKREDKHAFERVMKSVLMWQQQQSHIRLWDIDELPGTKLVCRRVLMMRSEMWIRVPSVMVILEPVFLQGTTVLWPITLPTLTSEEAEGSCMLAVSRRVFISFSCTELSITHMNQWLYLLPYCLGNIWLSLMQRQS